MGKKVAILDADITGPSIPKSFGITEHAFADEEGMNPVLTKTGIEVMSINIILPNEESPVIWRGPAIAGTVKQFWSDVKWGDIDYMFVDMPPGTGDVPLTVFQSLPVDGIIVVATPQELVEMIVAKAVNMANMMNIPVLGIVENMSYMTCPHCGEPINIFGESGVEKYAASNGIDILGKIPLNPEIAKLCDAGKAEEIENEYLDSLVYVLNGLMEE
jgi:Mrp family chromosome partitioning ATPase